MIKEVITFFSIRKEPCGEAIRWMFVTLIVSLIPLWGSALIFLLYKQNLSWGTFTNKAEFAIYAASYLGSAAYIVTKNFKRKNFPLRPWFFIFILITMFIAVICFAVVYGNSCSANPLSLDLNLLRNITFWTFIVSLFLAFTTYIEDQVLINFNIIAVEKEQLNKLNRDFDNLSGGGK